LNAGEISLIEIAQQEGLTLATDLMYYWAHWITPEGQPKRYDTRFFLARHPGGEARVADDELVEVWWERPADTLARLEAGELHAITPTISFLTSLSRYRHVADAFAGTELGHEHVFAWGITTF
ncbi:MAG: hypothetical protein ACPGNP_07745, partial [Acidimicrobiales bacterium]